MGMHCLPPPPPPHQYASAYSYLHAYANDEIIQFFSLPVSGRQSRLQQLIDWCGGEKFDGCLIFDECHKAKHFIPVSLKYSQPYLKGKSGADLT